MVSLNKILDFDTLTHETKLRIKDYMDEALCTLFSFYVIGHC
jgi:hypothetical protein